MRLHRQVPAARAESRNRAKARPQQRRPSVRQWLWYSVGGGLPPELSQWVLKDVTGRTWWLRHLARATLQMTPLLLVVLLALPGPLDLRVYTAVLGLFTGYFYSVFVMWGVTEHRLTKAGFAPGVSEQVREERTVARQKKRAAKYAAERERRPRWQDRDVWK